MSEIKKILLNEANDPNEEDKENYEEISPPSDDGDVLVEEEEEEEEHEEEEEELYEDDSSSTSKAKFDCTFMYRFGRIFCCHLGICHPGQLFLIILLFVISILQSICVIYESQIIGKFYNLFVNGDWNAVWLNIGYLTALLAGDGICSFINSMIQTLLFYFWRKNLTKSLLELYFENQNYYEILNFQESRIDNPDQRIASDAEDFTSNLSEVLTTFIAAIVLLLFSLGTIIYQGYYILLLPTFLWPILNICMYSLIFNPLARVVFEKDKIEGDFRRSHARIREHCESIAFFNAHQTEKKITATIFRKLIRILLVLAVKFIPLNFYINFSFQISNLSYTGFLIVMIFYNVAPFHKGMSIGEVSQELGSTYTIVIKTCNALDRIFQLSKKLSIVIGNTARIGQLFESFSELRKKSSSLQSLIIGDEDEIKFESVNCVTPTGKKLLDDISFDVPEGKSLVIMGPSGCGKSSILRILAGLWGYSEGVVQRPKKIGRDGIFFIPQLPYLIKGTLKENIVYPKRIDDVVVGDKELEEVLEMAGIGYLLQRASLHTVNVNWDEKLSLGEQQRVGIARCLFHRPKFAIMDESTSALDSYNEDNVYSQIKKRGISIISVAHRKSVLKFHDYLLTVDQGGNHKLREIVPSDIPIYDCNWKTLSHYMVSAEERDDFEITDYVDVELSDKNIGKSYGINLTFFKRVFRFLCCGILIRPCQWFIVLFAIFLSCLTSVAPMPLVLFSAKLMGAGSTKDMSGSTTYMAVYLGGYLLTASMMTINSFMIQIIGVMFRSNLVNFFHKRYFKNRLFYHINLLDKECENVDQRITQDSDMLTSGFDNSPGLPILATTLFGNLFQVCIVLVISSIQTGPLVAAFAFIVFFVLGCFQLLLLYLLSRYRYLQQKREGYLRTSLVRMKEYCEQIRFFNGKEREKLFILEKFSRVMKNQIIFTIIQSLNKTFIDVAKNFSILESFLVMALSFALGIKDFDSMTQGDVVAYVQMNMTYATNLVVTFLSILTVVNYLGNFIGNIGRVGQLSEKFRQLEKELANEQEIKVREKRYVKVKDFVKVVDLTAVTPSQKKLFYHLGFQIDCNDRLLIQGKSGCGKSTLLRIIGGLWPIRGAKIFAPFNEEDGDLFSVNSNKKKKNKKKMKLYQRKEKNSGLFFLPQTPYLSFGSLKSQIIYPDKRTSIRDEELAEILNQVNLKYIYERHGKNFHREREWTSILSPGEKQRINFARVLYHKPLFCILDESTSSLDEKNEEELYRTLIDNNISIISVGHRKSILPFHNKLLEFDGNGSWRFAEKVEVDEEIFKI